MMLGAWVQCECFCAYETFEVIISVLIIYSNDRTADIEASAENFGWFALQHIFNRTAC